MGSGPSGRLRQSAEALAIPVGALAAAMVVFGIAMAGLGRNPLEVYELIYRGAFASAFSWQNTLARRTADPHGALRGVASPGRADGDRRGRGARARGPGGRRGRTSPGRS